jgi:tetratricopeptide (TPR) repeat protein
VVAVELYELGCLEFNAGEIARAVTLLEDSLEMARDQGLKFETAWALADLGIIARYQEDYPKALSFFQEALAIFQGIGFERGQHYVLVNEGFVSYHQGDEARAQELFKESLVLSLDKGRGPLNSAMTLIGLSCLSTMDGKPERAARLLGAAEAWIESKSIPFAGLRAEYAEYERILAQVRAQLDESTFNRLYQEGREMVAEGLDRVLAYALQNI